MCRRRRELSLALHDKAFRIDSETFVKIPKYDTYFF